MLHTIDPAALSLNPFTLIGKDWALLTAGGETGFNPMTVSWGNMGVMWNKNIVTVYVRPQRYTKEFIDRSDKFTLSFFEESMRPALKLCGSKSGRDLNKVEATGLTPIFEDGTTCFAEAKLVLECKKIYQDKIRPEGFLAPYIKDCYPQEDYHIIYMGEILKVLTK